MVEDERFEPTVARVSDLGAVNERSRGLSAEGRARRSGVSGAGSGWEQITMFTVDIEVGR